MVRFLLEDVSKLISEFYLSYMTYKGLTSWNTKIFPQNLRQRHKERWNTEGNIKESKL